MLETRSKVRAWEGRKHPAGIISSSFEEMQSVLTLRQTHIFHHTEGKGIHPVGRVREDWLCRGTARIYAVTATGNLTEHFPMWGPG